MPCPFTGPKMFCAIPNFFEPAQKFIYIFSEIVFVPAQKFFEEALNRVKFLGWLKKFGPTQNILEPVKGQGNLQYLD